MSVYYNDNDPFVCDWLENLIKAGLLPPGRVDCRPIEEVKAADVEGYTQCHFFAGIGGWAYALQLAGWGDRPVWTGSCPCQPFSAAGKGQAEDDPRHLWPHWFRLIRECKPVRVFGEQVANAAGKGWLDVVSTDLEAEAYTVGAVVLGAHSVGAPHIRQRIWFVADSDGARRGPGWAGETCTRGASPRVEPSGLRATGHVDDAASARRNGTGQGPEGEAWNETRVRGPECGRATRELADAVPAGRSEGWAGSGSGSVASGGESGELADVSGTGQLRTEQPQDYRASSPRRSADDARPSSEGFSVWCGADWIPCRDGKARPVEPGTFPLAHGVPARVGRLRAYGNAIVPQVAAAFVSAYLEAVA